MRGVFEIPRGSHPVLVRGWGPRVEGVRDAGKPLDDKVGRARVGGTTSSSSSLSLSVLTDVGVGDRGLLSAMDCAIGNGPSHRQLRHER